MSKKVIMADDNKNLRELHTDFIKLRIEDAIVEAVSNGTDLVDRTKKGSYDLIITDLEMPGMNGLEAIRRIRESDKKTPVYLLSGYADDEVVARRALESGATGVIKKGDIEELKKVVNKYLK